MKRTKKPDNYDHNDPVVNKALADENWTSSRRAFTIKRIFEGESRIINVLLETPEQDYLEPPTGSLFLYGVLGSGKTIDACRRALPFVRQWFEDSYNLENKIPLFLDVVFYDVQNLLYQIKCTYNRESKVKEQDIIDRCINCDILILDDLDSERKTEDSDSKVSFILHRRHNKEKITIVTSNNLLTKESGYDMRTIRRITDTYEFIHFTKTWKEKQKRK